LLLLSFESFERENTSGNAALLLGPFSPKVKIKFMALKFQVDNFILQKRASPF
jgi:hypothetical protein